MDRSEEEELLAFGKFFYEIYYIGSSVFFDFFSGNWRNGFSDSRIEQFQIIINFGGSANGRSGICGIYLLFNGDGWSDPFDGIHFWFVQPSQKLTGIA